MPIIECWNQLWFWICINKTRYHLKKSQLIIIFNLRINAWLFRDYNLKFTERSENKRTILIGQSRRRRQQIWRPGILFLLQPETRKMIQKQPKIKLLLSQEIKWILSVSVYIIDVYVHFQKIKNSCIFMFSSTRISIDMITNISLRLSIWIEWYSHNNMFVD